MKAIMASVFQNFDPDSIHAISYVKTQIHMYPIYNRYSNDLNYILVSRNGVLQKFNLSI